MSIPYNSGWNRPFDRTLQIGDLIIIQGAKPASLNADYPNSDIIVFRKPGNPNELIVHRIVDKYEENGIFYFRTKGNGNPPAKWPSPIQPEGYDPWVVSQNLVVGKVVMRIPWVGYIVIFLG
jgi:signal peptidase I